MRYEISQQQLNFFSRHGYIEFENLVPREEARRLSQAIDQTLEKRTKGTLENKTPLALYTHGRDLFRDSPFIHTFATKRNLSTIASQLIQKNSIRLAFDQALRTKEKDLTSEEIFPHLFAGKTRLDQISCFQGLYLGLIINLNLDNKDIEEDIQIEGIDQLIPYPRRLGQCLFIRRDTPIHLEPLFQRANRSFYLIGYAQAKTQFVLNENDLNTQLLKQLGYAFGDHLKDEFHPIVY